MAKHVRKKRMRRNAAGEMVEVKRPERTAVYINGRLIGFHDTGEALLRLLREKRRASEVNYETNFALNKDTGELHISTDSGRARRPYIVVENGKSNYTPEMAEKVKKGELSWGQLIKMGVIEYLDAEEENDFAYVAATEKDIGERHTHLEIDPV